MSENKKELKASVEAGGIVILLLITIALGVLGYELFGIMSFVAKTIFGLFMTGCVISLTYRFLKWWLFQKERKEDEE